MVCKQIQKSRVYLKASSETRRASSPGSSTYPDPVKTFFSDLLSLKVGL